MGDDQTPFGKRVSRRQFIVGGAAAGAAFGLGGAQAAAKPGRADAFASGAAPPGAEAEDIFLVNGRIHTMDRANRVVSSVAIRNGRFAEVGHDASPGGRTRVINLKGRTVVPGLVDCHIHTVLMGVRPGYHTPLENASSIRDVQATLAARRRQVPAGQFITTIGGFHSNQFTERRLPTLAELDDAVKDRPVFVFIGFTGPATTNSLGKAFFESKGIVVGSDGSIAASPFFAPGPATQALLELRRLQTFEDRKRSALDAMAYATTVGLTTHLDQGAFAASGTAADGAANEDLFTMHAPFLALHQEGKMSVRLRINFLEGQNDPTLDGLRARLKYSFPFFGDDVIRTGGIGEFTADGLAVGTPLWTEGTRLVAQARWRNENHSLDTTDFQRIIQGWEAVNHEFPIGDLRWALAHVPFITRDYLDRLRALGGGVNLSGWRYLTGTSVQNGPPYRTILDSGIRAGSGGDGMQIAPMNPWLHLYYAVTGVNALGQLINGGQQISREQALRLYTSATPWFQREDDLGTIEAGNHADLVVLNEDYFRVSDERLKSVRSVLTIVGGRTVYDARVL